MLVSQIPCCQELETRRLRATVGELSDCSTYPHLFFSFHAMQCNALDKGETGGILRSFGAREVEVGNRIILTTRLM